jgi:hypothetical protein
MRPIAIAMFLSLLANTAHCDVVGACLPPVIEVQEKALEYARLEPGDISSWKKKARLQAFLPDLELEYDRRVRDVIDVNVDDSVYVGSSGVVVGPEDGKYAYNNNADQNVTVRAMWHLNETIFNPDMLNVSAEARRLSQERQLLLSELNKSYFDMKRFGLEISELNQAARKGGEDAPELRKKAAAKGVAYMEARASIDALTGGWFSAALEGRGDEKGCN